MFALIISIHVLACTLLIIVVLIQQGRGGGLIDSLSSAESIFGTKTNTFLVKSTSVFAVIFFITCLSLAFLSIQKSKSLIETSYRPPVETSLPAPAAAAPAKAAAPVAATPTTPAAPATPTTPQPSPQPSKTPSAP